jgi:hypothetical protein
MPKSKNDSHELFAILVNCCGKIVTVSQIQFGESGADGPMVAFECPECREYIFLSLVSKRLGGKR